MTNPFGNPIRLLEATAKITPAGDMALVRHHLTEVQPDGLGILRFYRPQPTAAVSSRDVLNPHFAEASAVLRARGFEPVERGAGGLLAAYDQSALVVDLVASHPEPRQAIHDRFRLFAECLVTAFIAAGIDARVGEVPGEYCSGAWSINAGGRRKLVGLAQRIRKTSYHLGAVVSVEPSSAALDAVTRAYAAMDVPFEPSTFGALTSEQPSLDNTEVEDLVRTALMARLLQP